MKRPTRNKILSAALSLAALPVMANGSIVVRSFVLSHGIHEREPISDTETFNVDDGKTFAFARIQNDGDPTMVSFVWERDNVEHATVPVSVGASSGWRTWSTAQLRSGNWRVKLVDAQGEVLLEKAFTVGDSFDGSVSSPSQAVQSDIGGPSDSNFNDDIPASVTFPMRW